MKTGDTFYSGLSKGRAREGKRHFALQGSIDFLFRFRHMDYCHWATQRGGMQLVSIGGQALRYEVRVNVLKRPNYLQG